MDSGGRLENLLGKIKQKLQSLSNKSHINADIVCIDIGGERLKLLKINSNVTPCVIENFAIAEVPAGLTAKEEIKNVGDLAVFLEKLFASANIASKDVAMAIPKSVAIIKTISIDNRLTAGEIESKAWMEANHQFPELIGNIYLDFAIAGPDAQDAKKSELVLVASRKDQMDPYLKLINLAGLKIKFIDVNCYAYERLIKRINQQELSLKTVALLNLNNNLISFVVVSGERLVHAHDHAFDSSKLLSQLKAIKNVEGEQPINPDDKAYTDILRANLLSQLRHVVHFFYSSKPNIAIQKLLLSGELANLPNLGFFIQQEIGLQTTVSNPLIGLTVAGDVNQDTLKQYASELALCVGLAIGKGKL